MGRYIDRWQIELFHKDSFASLYLLVLHTDCKMTTPSLDVSSAVFCPTGLKVHIRIQDSFLGLWIAQLTQPPTCLQFVHKLSVSLLPTPSVSVFLKAYFLSLSYLPDSGMEVPDFCKTSARKRRCQHNTEEEDIILDSLLRRPTTVVFST